MYQKVKYYTKKTETINGRKKSSMALLDLKVVFTNSAILRFVLISILAAQKGY